MGGSSTSGAGKAALRERHDEEVLRSSAAAEKRWYSKKDEGITLTGWPAVRMFFMLAATPVLTALVTSLIMAFPIQWLVSQVFSTPAIHAVFGVERLNYWRIVGLFAIWFATRARIKIQGPHQ